MWGHKEESTLQPTSAQQTESRTPPSRISAPIAAQAVAVASGSPVRDPSNIAWIGKSLKVRGEITGSEDLHIDGQVEGTITLRGNLTIGPSGRVRANASVRSITILGQFEGDIQASDRVVITRTGSLEADLVTPRIVIEDGAVFRGSIDIIKPGTEYRTRPRVSRLHLRQDHDFLIDFDAELAFDAAVPTDAAARVLEALAEYYRACGGLGLELSFDREQPPFAAPASAEPSEKVQTLQEPRSA